MTGRLLDLTEPESWGDEPNHKLVWLSMFYGIKADMIAKRVGSRTNLYYVMNGQRAVSPRLRQRIADVVGFPVEAWDWPLQEFDRWIRDNYPGFAGRFDTNGSAA